MLVMVWIVETTDVCGSDSGIGEISGIGSWLDSGLRSSRACGISGISSVGSCSVMDRVVMVVVMVMALV